MFTGNHVNYLAAYIEGKINHRNSQPNQNGDWFFVHTPCHAILKVHADNVMVAFLKGEPNDRLDNQRYLELTEGGRPPVLFVHDVVQPFLLEKGMTIISTGDQTVVMQAKTEKLAQRTISRAEGENHWMLALCSAFISLT
jgi:hypothetical protein